MTFALAEVVAKHSMLQLRAREMYALGDALQHGPGFEDESR